MSAERDLLLQLQAGPVSGDALARGSGQTRAAVWKRIEALRAAGIAIAAKSGQGYALTEPLDLLDADAIRAGIPASARARIASLEVAWSLDSTNAELSRRRTPEQGVAVLLAERQTGGRGRRGREWSSPLAANLYLSFARMFAGGLARLGGVSLVAGIAAVEALHALGYTAVRLKWPNDLVVDIEDGRGSNPGQALHKLGGLLVEGGGEHAGPVRAVLGIGVNVRMPRAAARDIDQPWTDLLALRGRPAPSRNMVAAALIAHTLPALDCFDREGLAPFLPRYAACDALAGREVDLHAGNGVHNGTVLGLADDGALRVRLREGERRFHAGEVSVRGAAA